MMEKVNDYRGQRYKKEKRENRTENRGKKFLKQEI